MIHKHIAAHILTHQDELAEAALTLQYTRQPELRLRYGEVEHEKSLRDMRYHCAYLAEAITVERPALFADYIAWAAPMLASYHVPVDVLRVTLETLRAASGAHFTGEARAVLDEYFAAGMLALHTAEPVAPFIQADAPHGALAQQYLDALLALVISLLYPRIFAAERRNRRLIATCIGGELHEIGVRMVADFFEMAGWDTFYLGANTPTDSIITTLRERDAEVLAVSATMTMHVSRLAALIDAVRQSNAADVKILVGGYPFNRVPDLWQQVGADGYAPNAAAAIARAEALLTSKGTSCVGV